MKKLTVPNVLIYKRILYAFTLSMFLVYILVVLNSPIIFVFLPVLVLHTLAFTTMLILLLLANKYMSISFICSYGLSIIIGYSILIFVVWRINEGNFLDFLVKYHTGKDFINLVLPFVISNIVIILFNWKIWKS